MSDDLAASPEEATGADEAVGSVATARILDRLAARPASAMPSPDAPGSGTGGPPGIS